MNRNTMRSIILVLLQLRKRRPPERSRTTNTMSLRRLVRVILELTDPRPLGAVVLVVLQVRKRQAHKCGRTTIKISLRRLVRVTLELTDPRPRGALVQREAATIVTQDIFGKFRSAVKAVALRTLHWPRRPGGGFPRVDAEFRFGCGRA